VELRSDEKDTIKIESKNPFDKNINRNNIPDKSPSFGD
jgi:hypothetical protein